MLSAGVLAGVVIGVALSLAWLRLRRDRAADAAARAGAWHHGSFASSTSTLTARPSRALAVVRLDGGLFFATADALHDRLREIAQERGPALHGVVLDLEGVDFADAQGSAKLRELGDLADANGVTLRLARVKARVLAVLRADGVIDRIGLDHVHGEVHEALEAQLDADGALAAPAD